MARRPKRVTIRDVAEATGLSQAAVSYAMRGLQVSGRTQERVRAAAAELGYEANPMARALASGRTGMVGVLWASLEDLWQQETAVAVGGALLARGQYALVVDSGGDPAREERLARRLDDQRVDALVLSPVDPSAGFWGTIADRVPLVTVGDALPGVRTAGEVVFDNRAGVTLALTHLRDLGHTRVGVLTPTAASTPDRPGDVHVRAEAERLGVDVTIVPARHALAAAAEAACTALARRPRPTALFCFSDSIAYGAYAAAAGLGLDVPGDLSVMGYDARPVSRLLGPPLTTVDWDTDAIVAAAARLVTAALDGQARRRRIVRHPTLLTGASTARPRRRVSR
ncbi:MAG: LacI family DNA-binding transcriptional regulator [Kineosporiaceae bacterium]